MKNEPTTATLSDAHEDASLRLLALWQQHLRARGVTIPDVADFLSFGGTAQLEHLQSVLNRLDPSAAGPVRVALRQMRGKRWRKLHPVPETRENRKVRKPARISVAEAELPRPWRLALATMRTLRARADKGLLDLDDRSAPSATVIRNLALTLRAFAWGCQHYGREVAITAESVDRYRAARHAAGNGNRSIAIRLKELLVFARWCELDEEVIDRLATLQKRYASAGSRERRRKDIWAAESRIGIADVWTKAEELLRRAMTAPAASARRERLLLDAACLAVSLVCPLRIGDLHRIHFGTHLRRAADGWSLDIVTNKTGQRYHRSRLWPELDPFLDALVAAGMPRGDVWSAYDRRRGTALFSRDFGGTGVSVGWPSHCWRRHFGTGAHIVRSLWHSAMFESEDDDQWIALALNGQGNARTAQAYILEGSKRRASRSARAKLRSLRGVGS